MESHRFDALTRRFARRRSRRALLGIVSGGLAGVAVTGLGQGRATAMQRTVPLGEVCYWDEQCFNDALNRPDLNYQNQLVWCQDNMLGYDGERNCCRYEGGLCSGHEHCCRDLLCLDGFCDGYYG